ncbi:MAG: hypothetical protein Q7U51_02400, partial [Methanoregula sp.]|nr:hypothetical protein [Methanoregula sp.]
ANSCSGAYGVDPAELRSDFYFGDDLTGMDLIMAGRCRERVGLYNRVTGEPEFVQKSFLGGTGTLWILDNIFLGVRKFPE